jgi:hypothetical protein
MSGEPVFKEHLQAGHHQGRLRRRSGPEPRRPGASRRPDALPTLSTLLVSVCAILRALIPAAAAAAAAAAIREQTIVAGGWVKTGRTAEKDSFAFLEINDGSCVANLQAPPPPLEAPANPSAAAHTILIAFPPGSACWFPALSSARGQRKPHTSWRGADHRGAKE